MALLIFLNWFVDPSPVRLLLFGSYTYVCAILFFLGRGLGRNTVSWQLWYEWLTLLNDHSPSDLADEPFSVAKYAAVGFQNSILLAQQDLDKEAFEDMIMQALACPQMFINFLLHL